MKFLFAFFCFVVFNSISISAQTEWEEGEVIVQLEQGVDVKYFLNELSFSSGLRFTIEEALVPSANIYSFSFSDPHIGVTAAIKILTNEPLVKIAQPNHTNIEMRKTSNDPNAIGQWYLDKINAPLAWDYTTGGSTIDSQEIVIAIVDVSFEISHGDLKDNFWKNKHEIPLNGIDDDKNGYIDDYDGWNVYEDTGYVSSKTSLGSIDKHGTQIAGIIGGVGNNRRDIAGLNWKVKMLPVQGSSTNEAVVIKSYNYILEMRSTYNRTHGDSGAFIVAQNSSFGVDRKFPAEFPIWCGLLDQLGRVGIVSIGAGPNSVVDIDDVGDIPCTCPSEYLITVTRSDEQDKLFGGGYGKESMDMAAPGKQIFTTSPVNSTSQAGGSSFAAPMATAALGLMYAVYPQEFYSSSPDSMALRSAIYLRQSVELLEVFDTITTSGGRLDLHKAVLIAQDALVLSAIDKQSLSISAKVFPNPSKGSFIFETVSIGSIEIFDMNGVLILRKKIENTSTLIETQELSAGIYLLNFIADNQIFRKKIIIEN
ncbi:MAG: S8 family peptidase [Salibacteraceae bacterium]|nr:S8 family peptidase [Salibacteraceae bacterium]